MTADIARITYDPTRQYRSVVTQQGRVTLEADNNEAAIIASEALRLETIDVIGPAGTPDDGYKVASGLGFGGVSIGPGTYYLGGWRLHLDTRIDLAIQPDWLDAPPPTARGSGNSAVALLLTEQSVCAVEDLALREVALGGPDSAARTRLMQQFLRLRLDGTTCVAGADRIKTLISADGLTLDAKTPQLLSNARLKADVVPGPPGTDPCEPTAAGGYLGADNQLVRVTVIAYDPNAQTGTLLWSWNNASLLYRASASNPLTLMLTNTPVDEEHAPQAGQAVEILRSRANLGDNSYIAAPQGFVTTLAQGYSFDTGQIALNDALPTDYQNDKNPLFVRLWQAKVPFTGGQVTPLDSTSGITVTITLTALPTQIGLRPFWRFAVRPSTSVQIHPQRYQEASQPPDGPRQWITELAVVQANESGATLLSDCRVPFVPLIKQQGGGCDLVLGPADVAGRGGLQAVVDSLKGNPAVVSLRPGTYTLAAPLVLGPQHAGLVLEGCSGGVILQAAAADVAAFLPGMIVMQKVAGITLRRLDLAVPAVTTVAPPAAAGMSTLVGLGIAGAQSLTVEECTFALDEATATSSGSGILAIGALSNIVVRRSTFSCTAAVGAAALSGIAVLTSTSNAATTLDATRIADCQFHNLTIGVLGYAQLGLIRCTGNVVTESISGLIFSEANLGASNSFVKQAQTIETGAANSSLALAVNAGYKIAMLTDVVSKAAPIIAKLSPTAAPPEISSVAWRALAAQYAVNGQTVFSTLAAAGPSEPVQGASVASTAAATTTTAGTPMFQLSSAALDTIDHIAIAAETAAPALTPALRFDANEVMLAATKDAPGVGLAVVLAIGGQPGSVTLGGNRIVVPDGNTSACALLFPVAATVTGNVLFQLPATRSDVAAAATLVVLGERKLPYFQVAANVSHPSDYVFPPRSAPATGTWEFLNTVR